VDETEQFLKKRGRGVRTSLAFMPNKITHTQVYVVDQDEALDFYVGKLGFALNTDADLGFMRWLTVNFPGQPDHQLLLEKPGPPAHDDATAEQIRELVTKGAMGMAAIIAVDDVHKTYKELVAKGVEFTEEPTERFYGTDCGLRDPFGNHLRIGTPKDGPTELEDVPRAVDFRRRSRCDCQALRTIAASMIGVCVASV
jgi:catechol 2,3-dioxygenase-like lactoylglutathione lyase family enzyme